MSATVSARVSSGQSSPFARLGRHRGLLVAWCAFFIAFGIVNAVSSGSFNYFEFSFMSAGGATLALAAMGQTFVVLTGGFDLSTGAVVSLVNVILAVGMKPTGVSEFLFFFVALGVGALVGAVNGFFVAFGRMQSIVVTLSTMFVVQGVTLLIMNKPGGMIPGGFSSVFTGTAIPHVLPAPVAVLLVASFFWYLLKNSRLGVGLYAVGSDEDSARATGIRTRSTKFAAYVIAGMLYGAAGAFISAQTGSADPLIGRPMLLQVFAAVVLGGTALGGGRGGCIGSIIGAYTLMMVVNILLVLNVSAYYSSIAEGVVLLLAVLGAALNRRSPAAYYLQLWRTKLTAAKRGIGLAAKAVPATLQHNRPAATRAAREGPAWLVRNRDTLRSIWPAYLGFLVVLVVSQLAFGTALANLDYINSLLVLTSFLAILALGQGAAILTGGLDLSIPWMIGFVGILTSAIINGSNLVALWAVPMGLGVGVLFGAVNGVGIVFLGLPPIVMTLAMNGILEGLALLYCNGTPAGFASPAQRWFMTGHLLGLTPVVWFLVLFVGAAVIGLSRTPFGRRIYAVGNSVTVARLSAVGVGGTTIGVYALSGFCSALVGILLSGFSGQASLGMGDSYLLPSIAIVVVGGTLISGGKGHYLGMLGGALLLTAISTLLAGTALPDAVRDIIFGLVVLTALLAMRERQA